MGLNTSSQENDIILLWVLPAQQSNTATVTIITFWLEIQHFILWSGVRVCSHLMLCATFGVFSGKAPGMHTRHIHWTLLTQWMPKECPFAIHKPDMHDHTFFYTMQENVVCCKNMLLFFTMGPFLPICTAPAVSILSSLITIRTSLSSLFSLAPSGT